MRRLGQSVPRMSVFAKTKVAAAKIFIDQNNKSGIELESVTG